jgi:hypothetical protein
LQYMDSTTRDFGTASSGFITFIVACSLLSSPLFPSLFTSSPVLQSAPFLSALRISIRLICYLGLLYHYRVSCGLDVLHHS